jgi:hypothetical protein
MWYLSHILKDKFEEERKKVVGVVRVTAIRTIVIFVFLLKQLRKCRALGIS